jgi:hypothetical protein
LAERIRSFSGLAIFTLVMSFGMIINELIPFIYRACKAGSVVNGFHIPVLELCAEDVEDVKKFRDAVTMQAGREVARKIKRRYEETARARGSARLSGKHLMRAAPGDHGPGKEEGEGEGKGQGTGPGPKGWRSKAGQDGRQGLREISSRPVSCHRVTPSSAPLPPIHAGQ